jgi:hypothetical protein
MERVVSVITSPNGLLKDALLLCVTFPFLYENKVIMA